MVAYYRSLDTGKPVFGSKVIWFTVAPPVRRVKVNGGYTGILVERERGHSCVRTALQLLLGPKVGILTLWTCVRRNIRATQVRATDVSPMPRGSRRSWVTFTLSDSARTRSATTYEVNG